MHLLDPLVNTKVSFDSAETNFLILAGIEILPFASIEYLKFPKNIVFDIFRESLTLFPTTPKNNSFLWEMSSPFCYFFYKENDVNLFYYLDLGILNRIIGILNYYINIVLDSL